MITSYKVRLKNIQMEIEEKYNEESEYCALLSTKLDVLRFTYDELSRKIEEDVYGEYGRMTDIENRVRCREEINTIEREHINAEKQKNYYASLRRCVYKMISEQYGEEFAIR